jgi:hypothetical protein
LVVLAVGKCLGAVMVLSAVTYLCEQFESKTQGQSPPVLATPNLPPGFSHGLDLEPDQVVRHPAFGQGRVVAVRGAGAEAQAEIEFVSLVGVKRLMLKYAPLRLIGSS